MLPLLKLLLLLFAVDVVIVIVFGIVSAIVIVLMKTGMITIMAVMMAINIITNVLMMFKYNYLLLAASICTLISRPTRRHSEHNKPRSRRNTERQHDTICNPLRGWSDDLLPSTSSH